MYWQVESVRQTDAGKATILTGLKADDVEAATQLAIDRLGLDAGATIHVTAITPVAQRQSGRP